MTTLPVIFDACLPWPPSVNRYWRSVRGRAILSAEARAYREVACLLVASAIARREAIRAAVGERLAIKIVAYPPDRRERDADNILKPLLDCLQRGGLVPKDSQFKRLTISWRDGRIRRDESQVRVRVWTMKGIPCES